MQWEPTDRYDLKSALQKFTFMAKTDIGSDTFLITKYLAAFWLLDIKSRSFLALERQSCMQAFYKNLFSAPNSKVGIIKEHS